eukprot:623035_1
MTRWGKPKSSRDTETEEKADRFRQGQLQPGASKFQRLRVEKEKKKKSDRSDAALVYAQFVESFKEEAPEVKHKPSTFVRGGFVNPETGESSASREAAFYTPKHDLPAFKKPPAKRSAPIRTFSPARPSQSKKRKKGKGPRNIDLFLNELKMQEQLREDRKTGRLPPAAPDPLLHDGSFDDGDPMTTNIYVGNLPTHITELDMLTEFGKFGPIGSVKIMWPRTDEERARGRNCGFVSFMTRPDADDCMDAFKDDLVFGTELRLGWGKRVQIPPIPLPMPKTSETEESKFKSAPSTVVIPEDAKVLKVRIPENEDTVRLIDLVAKYVAKDGYALEQCIADRYKSDVNYKFLFKVDTIEHLYYRWKLSRWPRATPCTSGGRRHFRSSPTGHTGSLRGTEMTPGLKRDLAHPSLPPLSLWASPRSR